MECSCNGHGDAALGYCDPDNGTCFCRDSTRGFDCSQCVENYYGDPKYDRLRTCYLSSGDVLVQHALSTSFIFVYDHVFVLLFLFIIIVYFFSL